MAQPALIETEYTEPFPPQISHHSRVHVVHIQVMIVYTQRHGLQLESRPQ